MNPQPNPIVGNLLAFVLFLVFCYYCYKAFNDGNPIYLKDIDLINIGYLQDSKTSTQVLNIMPAATPVNNFESQQLYIDCIETMVALGFKKSEAKRKAKFIFSTINPQPSSVQEFLNIALSIPS